MARDMRTNRNDYPIRCKYYEGKYVNKMKLVQDPVCKSVFYCQDLGAFETGKTKENGYMATGTVGRIETLDTITVKADDFIYYSGALHRIEDFKVADDNRNKEFSVRPIIKTTIDLRR